MWCVAVLAALLSQQRLTHFFEQVGVDIDEDAIALTAANVDEFEDAQVDLLHARVNNLPPTLRADTVLMCVPDPSRLLACDGYSLWRHPHQEPAVRHSGEGRGHGLPARRRARGAHSHLLAAQGAGCWCDSLPGCPALWC